MAGERPGGADWGHDPDSLRVLRDGVDAVEVAVPPGNYGRFYQEMRDAIRAGQPVPVTPAEAMAVMAIIAAGLQSSAEGRAVSPAALASR